jgi:hypothetical protein
MEKVLNNHRVCGHGCRRFASGAEVHKGVPTSGTPFFLKSGFGGIPPAVFQEHLHIDEMTTRVTGWESCPLSGVICFFF